MSTLHARESEYNRKATSKEVYELSLTPEKIKNKSIYIGYRNDLYIVVNRIRYGITETGDLEKHYGHD